MPNTCHMTTPPTELTHAARAMPAAVDAAFTHATRLQREGFERFTKASAASPHELVTSADREAQEILVRTLAAAAPGIPFVGEEQGTHDLSHPAFFVADPIDGTSDFAAGGSSWGVILGLIHEGQPIAGVARSAAGVQVHCLPGAAPTINGEPLRLNASTGVVTLPGGAWLETAPGQAVRKALSDIGWEVQPHRCALAAQLPLYQGTASACLALGERIWDLSVCGAVIGAAGGAHEGLTGVAPGWSVVTPPPSLFCASHAVAQELAAALRPLTEAL